MKARRPFGTDAKGPTEHAVPHSRRFSDKLVEDARQLFQERTTRTLTSEDARQILENLTGFFTVLHDMDRARMKRETEADSLRAENDSQP